MRTLHCRAEPPELTIFVPEGRCARAEILTSSLDLECELKSQEINEVEDDNGKAVRRLLLNGASEGGEACDLSVMAAEARLKVGMQSWLQQRLRASSSEGGREAGYTGGKRPRRGF